MRLRAAACAGLLLTACTPGVWQARRGVDAAGSPGRLHLPRLFEPLVPGSMYPDRRKPLPAAARPGVVVVLPPAADRRALEGLGERGIVTLVLGGRVDGDRLARAARWLAGREECRGARIGALVPGTLPVGSGGLDGLHAIALVGYTPGDRLAAGAEVAVFNLAGGDGPSPAFTERLQRALGSRAVEKWYRGNARERLPAEAWRDAAEWLALVLGA